MTSHTPPLTRRRFTGLMGGAALAAPLIGTRAFGQGSNVYKIGYIGPRSGPLGIFGAADTYLIDTIRANLAGGVDVNGTQMQVEIITADTQSDPVRASQITRDMINSENPDLILTHSAPETVNPVSDACEAGATPCLSTVAPWEAYYFGRGGRPGEQTFKWTFHYSFGSGNFLNLYNGQWSLLDTNRKVGTLIPSDADGNAIRAGLLPALEQSGWEVIDPGPYENMSQDFTTHINAFRDAGVDIVVCFPFPPDFPVFWRQAAQRGLAQRLKIMQMAKAGLFAAEMEALGDLGHGLCTGVYWHPAFPFNSVATGLSNAELGAGYEAATGRQWAQALGASASLFDAALALATQAGDPKDKEAMAAALPMLRAETAVGTVDFNTGPVANCAVSGLAGGQWNKASDGPWQFQLDLVSNADFPQIELTADFRPLAFG
ncbi:ABC transporter substrate-binding protein [Roseinatronobacter alkalisoli]|uniref:ABC transporter substrate-binding protein n=1 Tax=Roseinatronobacter alkalisoli TaxID=3028235 RepID=A0ABT5T7L1_9RHOB|nr:ABC transporter substrate-binding protein [Roseinatronobacter sp. HJB301]MDD7970956.1 ABC transporter substrate-binding protein [Roseinatronobacter sp. HJB301]